MAGGTLALPGEKEEMPVPHVLKDGADSIGGMFSGLPEGQIFSVTSGSFSANFQITYQGGDGNDVVLTVVHPPTGITATLAGGVLYVIGTSAYDTIIVDQLGSDELLLYASNYPHQHAADPEEALLRHLPESLARKIRSENARNFYRLPA